MAKSKKKSPGIFTIIVTVIIAIVLVVLQQKQHIANNTQAPPAGGTGTSAPEQASTGAGDDGGRAIIDAFDAQRSDVIVEFDAVVTKLLPDDDEGDRHQKFIVRLENFDHTILVSHNIDLAPRVPVSEGDEVRIKGEYEYSDRGGVVHWTHHNPNRNPRHPGGWIDHNGERYE